MNGSKIFRNRNFFVFDIIGAAVIYMLSVLFVFGIREATISVCRYFPVALCSMASIYVMFFVMGVYRVLWPYAGSKDYVRVTGSCVMGM
ncbi:MAG: hypothetical protein IJ454_02170, partial [Clostridia bacterium]|nr:hypothetical protein [Clostridia bacterium]